MSTFDDLWSKTRSAPVPYIFGAPKIVPDLEPDADIPLFDLTDELIDAATVAERDAIIADLATWGALRLPFSEIAIRFNEEKIADVLGWASLPSRVGSFLTMRVGADGPLKVETVYLSKELISDERRRQEFRTGVTREVMAEWMAAGRTHTRQVVRADRVYSGVWIEEPKSSFWADINKNAEIGAKGDKSLEQSIQSDMLTLAAEALTILLASLTARNVVKDVRYNGTGENGPNYLGSNEITYLSRTVVRPPAIYEGGEGGVLVRPFLVRGFIRNQVADTTGPQPPDTRITVLGKGRAGRREQWIAPFYKGVDPDYATPSPRHYVMRP